MERKDVIQELQLRYAEKKVIPFIGAGLSAPFSLPTWDDLIGHLKELIDQNLWPAIDDDLVRGEYQEAIDDIKKFARFDEQVIQEKIADLYDIDLAKPEEGPDNNYLDLAKAGFSLYLTTNYDKLFEWYLPEVNSFASLTEYKSNVQRLFSDSKKNIFHIHGAVRNPNTIVISSESYKKLYEDPRYNDLMKSFSSSHSFLFLGFSFNDVFIQNLLKEHKSMYRGNHYLIISKDSLHRDKVLELNQKYGIKTIEYDSSDSSHLIEIRKILEEITQEPVEVMPNTKVQSGVQFEELELTGTHEANLFYKKLEIANVDPELRELSTLFYIAAEKFIRESMRLGFPKEYIDETLVEVFLRYREKYTVLYTLQKKDSNELLIAI
ncbi:hypothetical protein E5K19_002456, partial [Enterococcus faecium]|nr:hypothetical protein [Enterococcus faecium]